MLRPSVLLIAALGLLGSACRSTDHDRSSPADDELADFVFVQFLAAEESHQLAPGELQDMIAAHERWVRGLRAQGRVLLAGPLAPPRADPRQRAIAIVDLADVGQVLELAEENPAVTAGVLTAEAWPCRAPRSLRGTAAAQRERVARLSPDAGPADFLRPYVLAFCSNVGTPRRALELLRQDPRVLVAGEFGGPRAGETLLVLDVADAPEGNAMLVVIAPELAACTLLPWFGPRALSRRGASTDR